MHSYKPSAVEAKDDRVFLRSRDDWSYWYVELARTARQQAVWQFIDPDAELNTLCLVAFAPEEPSALCGPGPRSYGHISHPHPQGHLPRKKNIDRREEEPQAQN